MLYSITVKKQYVTDPSNPDETETKDTEVLVDPDGNKTLGDSDQTGKTDTPTTPTIPEDLNGEWDNATDENGNPKWTTDPTDPDGNDVNSDDTKLYPVYEKEVKVTRYIHGGTTLPELTGKVYRTADDNSEITPAEINLGTTEGYKVQVGKDTKYADPKGWSKTKGETAKEEVKPKSFRLERKK